jgi:hypothetical protein
MNKIITIFLIFVSLSINGQDANILTQGGHIKKVASASNYKVKWTDTANYEGNSITNGGVATLAQYEYVSRVTSRTGAAEHQSAAVRLKI